MQRFRAHSRMLDEAPEQPVERSPAAAEGIGPFSRLLFRLERRQRFRKMDPSPFSAAYKYYFDRDDHGKEFIDLVQRKPSAIPRYSCFEDYNNDSGFTKIGAAEYEKLKERAGDKWGRMRYDFWGEGTFEPGWFRTKLPELPPEIHGPVT